MVAHDENGPVEMSAARKRVCQTFTARVMARKFDRDSPSVPGDGGQVVLPSSLKPSVWHLIYDSSTRCNGLLTEPEGWNWVHLEANNKLWTEDLVKALSSTGIIPGKIDAILDFLEASYSEKFQMPNRCTTLDMLSLSFPCFDSETADYIYRDDLGRDEKQTSRLHEPTEVDQDHFHAMRWLGQAYAEDPSGNFFGGNLDISRSLDSSVYMAPVDASIRKLLEKDQVVYRHTSAIYKKNPRFKPEILMVSHLKLWKIGNTVITSFPRRWTNATSTLIDVIWHGTGRGDAENGNKTEEPKTKAAQGAEQLPFASIYDMVKYIVRECIDALESPHNAGLQKNLCEIFSNEIANHAIQQLRNYKDFTDASQEKDQLLAADIKRRVISNEIETYRQIMDIRDELSMIKHVRNQQWDIATSLLDNLARVSKGANTNEQASGGSTPEPSSPPGAMEDRINLGPSLGVMTGTMEAAAYKWYVRFKNLDRRAEKVESSLKHSIDLKLKQSSLDEARDTNIQARESMKQSNILFAFTIVTVLFSPLSFVATFFAIPSQSFPYDDTKNAVNWRRDQIGVGLSVAVAAVALPCLFLWMWFARENPEPPRRHTGGEEVVRDDFILLEHETLHDEADDEPQTESNSRTMRDTVGRVKEQKGFVSWRRDSYLRDVENQ